MQRVSWYALLVLLAGSSYGVVSSLMKEAYARGYNVQDVTSAQYVFGVIVLWLLAALWRRKGGIPRKQRWVLVVLGLAGAGTSITYYEALSALPASLGIVLLFQFSWIVLVMDIIVTRRWPKPQKWLGIAFVVVGTVLAVGLLEQRLGSFSLWAVLLGLMAAFCYALTLYLSGYVDTSSSPALRSAVTISVSAIAVFCVFPPTYLSTGTLWHGLWMWGSLTALFSQVIPMSLMLIAVPHTGGRMAGVLGAIELPVTVLVARVTLGEQVSALRWAGVILILLGIVISEWNFRISSLKSRT